MASRASVIHDYHARGTMRARRDVRFSGDDEPVVLPRRGSWDISFTLVAAGVAAAAITAGAAYSVLGSGEPDLRPSEAATLFPTWTVDTEPTRALLLERFEGPAHAVRTQGGSADLPEPELRAVTPAPVLEELQPPPPAAVPLQPEPPRTATEIPSAPPAERPVDPEFPAAPAQPEAPPPAPYPDPTTTPPEIMPPNAEPLDPIQPNEPQLPGPALDPENPY